MSEQTTSTGSRVRGVRRRHPGRAVSDGAGVRIRRTIGLPDLEVLDPFLLLDEFRSDEASDYLAGFPDHPHRGFETVTYMLAGRMQHNDSVGNRGDLGPGWVQWMTAGRGIIHSEMPQQEEGLMWGFQIWVNLPADKKMSPPRYQDIAPEGIPEVTAGEGVRARVIAGEFQGAVGPIQGVATSPLFLDLALQAGARCEVPIPAGHTALLYVFDGSLVPTDGHEEVPRGQLVMFGDGDLVRLRAGAGPDAEGAGGRCILLAGAPLREPVARHGPFVMNTREELIQAFRDYQTGQLTAPVERP